MVLIPILLPMVMVGIVLAVALAPVAILAALILGVAGFTSSVFGAVSSPFAALLKILPGMPKAGVVPHTGIQ